jgi:hypothetical protein
MLDKAGRPHREMPLLGARQTDDLKLPGPGGRGIGQNYVEPIRKTAVLVHVWRRERDQPFRPMTDRWPATYRQRIIPNQPNTDSKKVPRKRVSLTPAETRVLFLLPTYRTLAAIGAQLRIGRPTVNP